MKKVVDYVAALNLRRQSLETAAQITVQTNAIAAQFSTLVIQILSFCILFVFI